MRRGGWRLNNQNVRFGRKADISVIHSITSSARVIIVGGMVSPSALAWRIHAMEGHPVPAGVDAVAIQIPTATATRPATRLSPIPSPIASAPMIEANTGLTVIVTAALVGWCARARTPRE